jgi:hypothetical protein
MGAYPISRLPIFDILFIMKSTLPPFAADLSRMYMALDKTVFSSLLEDRAMGIAITSAAFIHTVLAIVGLPSWYCPIREHLRFPCPGCGLSRSITALLHGEWETSLTIHAFGPLIFLAFGLLGIVNLLPKNHRIQHINRVKSFEEKTGFTAIVLIGLVLYWLTRIIFFREFFFGLVMN